MLKNINRKIDWCHPTVFVFEYIQHNYSSDFIHNFEQGFSCRELLHSLADGKLSLKMKPEWSNSIFSTWIIWVTLSMMLK